MEPCWHSDGDIMGLGSKDESVWRYGYIEVISGLYGIYWGYMGIMEKKMELL